MSSMFGLVLPDLGSSLDTNLAMFGAQYIIMAAFSNLDWLKIPVVGKFLKRDGGLMTYSKFAKNAKLGVQVPSRLGMFLLYAPAAIVSTYTLSKTDGGADAFNSRAWLGSCAMVLHFAKRCAECLFLHRYSGGMPLATSAMVASGYTLVAWTVCHYASAVPLSLASDYTFPIGTSLFLIGLAGNFYHHYLLASLRKSGEKGYKVPTGGFFELAGGVAAPHYLFELVGWLGVVFIAQHVTVLLVFIAMAVYLFDRAAAQTEWNREKIPGYPASRKNILPCIF